MEKGRAELAIGGLSPILPNAQKFTYSFVYHTTPSVFIVKSDLRFGPIQRLLKPLQPSVWLMIIVQSVVGIVIIEILERVRRPEWRNFVFGSRNKHPIRHMFVSSLGYALPANVLPRRNFARFLLIAWLLLTLELRNAYQGKMFDSLRLAKRRPVPPTIEALIRHDYILLAPGITNLYPANKTSIVANTIEILHQLNENERPLTSIALLDHLMNYNSKYWHNSSLTYVNENVYSYQCAMFFRKHSILPASFNAKLKLLSDAGITAHIANRHVRWQKHPTKDLSASPEVQEITSHHLIGMYRMYGVLSWISVVIFVFELLSKRSKRLKLIMDWLN